MFKKPVESNRANIHNLYMMINSIVFLVVMVWFHCFWYQIKANDLRIQLMCFTMENIKVMQFCMQIKRIYLNNVLNTITLIFIIIDVILLLLTTEIILNNDQTSQKKKTERKSTENKGKRILTVVHVVFFLVFLNFLYLVNHYPFVNLIHQPSCRHWYYYYYYHCFHCCYYFFLFVDYHPTIITTCYTIINFFIIAITAHLMHHLD